jgi:hypothetical protein
MSRIKNFSLNRVDNDGWRAKFSKLSSLQEVCFMRRKLCAVAVMAAAAFGVMADDIMGEERPAAPAKAAKGKQQADSKPDIYFNGVASHLFYIYKSNVNGVEACAAGPAVTGKMNGFQTSVPVVIATELSGMQMSVVNIASDNTGFQLGVVNITKTASGAQLGLVNVIKDNWLPFFPGINFSF